MRTTEPFAIVWKSELEMDLDPGEFKVYLAIKSFSGNATLEVVRSTREIAARCSLSQPYVLKIIPLLVEKKVIEIVGKKTRVGGSVNVYKVIVPVISKRTPQLSLKENKVITPVALSDNPSEKSDNNLRTKMIQSNKVNKVIEKTPGISKNYFGKQNNENSSLKDSSSQSPSVKELPKNFYDKALDLAEKLSAKKVEEERRAK